MSKNAVKDPRKKGFPGLPIHTSVRGWRGQRPAAFWGHAEQSRQVKKRTKYEEVTVDSAFSLPALGLFLAQFSG